MKKTFKAIPGKGIVANTRNGKRPIKAASASVSVPAPFNKYYKVATKADCESRFGDCSDWWMIPADAYENYSELELVGHAIAKPEYAEALSEFELVDIVIDHAENSYHGNGYALVYSVGRRIYDLSIEEVEADIEMYEDMN